MTNVIQHEGKVLPEMLVVGVDAQQMGEVRSRYRMLSSVSSTSICSQCFAPMAVCFYPSKGIGPMAGGHIIPYIMENISTLSENVFLKILQYHLDDETVLQLVVV